jgi:hypothetical protein
MAKIGQHLDRAIQIYIAAITTYGFYLGKSGSTSPLPTDASSSGLAMTACGHWTIPLTLIASGVALSIINYLVKWRTRSNVDSPLKRLPNGMLAWKDSPMEQIANKAFVNDTVRLDGRRFFTCTFEHCTFIYEGTAPTELLENCQLIRRAPNEINFTIRTSNPVVMTALIVQARIAQGGPGLAGVRFEPVN